MAGAAIIISVDDHETREFLAGAIERLENPLALMKNIGDTARTAIVRNFEEGGRPDKWDKSRRVIKFGGKTLMNQGSAGGLAGSIKPKAEVDRVIIGTNKVYAAVHQFGIDETVQIKGHTRLGRPVKAHSKKMLIKARPYLMLQDEDWDEIRETANDFIIMEGK